MAAFMKRMVTYANSSTLVMANITAIVASGTAHEAAIAVTEVTIGPECGLGTFSIIPLSVLVADDSSVVPKELLSSFY